MDILFQGSEDIPTSFGGLPVLTAGATEAEVKAIYDAGKITSPDYTVIIQDAGARFAYSAPRVYVASSVILRKTAFKKHCYEHLGLISTPTPTTPEEVQAGGIKTYGKIIKTIERSNDDSVYGAYDAYNDATDITKEDAATFMGILKTGGVVSAEEYDAVINKWPVA
jgi:hypothetical protein